MFCVKCDYDKVKKLKTNLFSCECGFLKIRLSNMRNSSDLRIAWIELHHAPELIVYGEFNRGKPHVCEIMNFRKRYLSHSEIEERVKNIMNMEVFMSVIDQ